MPTPIPTLGYPSRTAAAVAMRARGLKAVEIGRRIGPSDHPLTHKQVSSLIRGSKKKTVNFPRNIMEMLEPHAKSRGMSVSGLAIAIVFAAAEDGMVDAILDDQQ